MVDFTFCHQNMRISDQSLTDNLSWTTIDDLAGFFI